MSNIVEFSKKVEYCRKVPNIVEKCRILSNNAAYCGIISNYVEYCQILSKNVTVQSGGDLSGLYFRLSAIARQAVIIGQ